MCKEVRAAHSLPILILTARNSDIDQVLGLELGADDFVIKPVEPRVLVARIHALLRRSRATVVHGASYAAIRQPVHRHRGPRRARRTRKRSRCRATSSTCCSTLRPTPARSSPAKRSIMQLYRREYDGVDRTLDVRISAPAQEARRHGRAGAHQDRVGTWLPVRADGAGRRWRATSCSCIC